MDYKTGLSVGEKRLANLRDAENALSVNNYELVDNFIDSFLLSIDEKTRPELADAITERFDKILINKRNNLIALNKSVRDLDVLARNDKITNDKPLIKRKELLHKLDFLWHLSISEGLLNEK